MERTANPKASLPEALKHVWVTDKATNKPAIAFYIEDSPTPGRKKIGFEDRNKPVKPRRFPQQKEHQDRETIADRLPYEDAVAYVKRIIGIYIASDPNFYIGGQTIDGNNFSRGLGF